MKTVEQEQDGSAALGLAAECAGRVGGAGRCGEGRAVGAQRGCRAGVLSEMMEAELDEVVGPKHAKISERTAVRHGHEDGEVTLGGRRVAVKRPRARTADGEQEVPLGTYEYFADRDPLDAGRVGADARRGQHAPLLTDS